MPANFPSPFQKSCANYIEVRFQVWAARRTTEEFLHDLLDPSDALLASHRDLLADFLHHCDLAKFARWILSVEEMETMLQSARTFVHRNRQSRHLRKPASWPHHWLLKPQPPFPNPSMQTINP